jgi:signal transduction histidine kinase
VENLDTIAAEAGRLANLVEEMRQITLAREYSKDMQPVDIGKAITKIAGLFVKIFERKGTTLRFEIVGTSVRPALNLIQGPIVGTTAPGRPRDEPFLVLGNENELSQVLFNLLRNADNHTENGVVTIKCELIDNSEFIRISVCDTGAGIAPELLPRLFERGVHGENDGSGYGLAICKDIITAYGGEIWIESEYGKGTTAAFTLRPYKSEREGANE